MSGKFVFVILKKGWEKKKKWKPEEGKLANEMKIILAFKSRGDARKWINREMRPRKAFETIAVYLRPSILGRLVK